jgi:hypothetical protein
MWLLVLAVGLAALTKIQIQFSCKSVNNDGDDCAGDDDNTSTDDEEEEDEDDNDTDGVEETDREEDVKMEEPSWDDENHEAMHKFLVNGGDTPIMLLKEFLEKKETHDLMGRIIDALGNEMWVVVGRMVELVNDINTNMDAKHMLDCTHVIMSCMSHIQGLNCSSEIMEFMEKIYHLMMDARLFEKFPERVSELLTSPHIDLKDLITLLKVGMEPTQVEGASASHEDVKSQETTQVEGASASHEDVKSQETTQVEGVSASHEDVKQSKLENSPDIEELQIVESVSI